MNYKSESAAKMVATKFNNKDKALRATYIDGQPATEYAEAHGRNVVYVSYMN